MEFSILLQIIEPIILANGESQCPICQKIMKTKGMITRHILIHTGEKSYKCSEFNYASNQSHNLKKHINNKHCNTEEKPFACTECPYTSNQNENLN